MKNIYIKFSVLIVSIFFCTISASSEPQEENHEIEPINSLHFEEVQFQNKEDSIDLSGTLTIPSLSNGSRPAIVLISGDGPQTRDEPILVALSNYLANRGFIVLRTDKRGTGRSSGHLSEATTADLARDVAAAVTFLKKDDRITSGQVGLIGHSEGALIAAMVASKVPKIAFIALMAYPVVGIEETLHLQRELRLRDQGASDDLIAFERLFWMQVFTLIRRGIVDEEIGNAAALIESECPEQLLQEYKNLHLENPYAMLKEDLSELKSPWFQYLLSYSPTETLSQVQCPVFAIFAEKDWQVPSTENKESLERVLENGQCPDCLIEVIPGLNHRFQTAETGSPKEYASLQEPISPLALQRIGEWLKKKK